MIKLFYTNKKLITISLSVLTYYRSWNLRFASRAMNDFLKTMSEFLTQLKEAVFPNTYYNDILSILKTILAAQENNDTVLIADIVELNLIPALYTIQQGIIQQNPEISLSDMFDANINALKSSDTKTALLISHATASHIISKSTDTAFYTEPSTIGSNTLKCETSSHSFYFHSNNNPYEEGRVWANTYSDDEYFNYTVLGFGMGYHVRALLEYDRRYEVTVFETNADILSLAFTYGDISDILSNPRFHLVYVSDLTYVAKLLSDKDTRLLIHYPSMEALPDSSVKQALKQYFIKLDSMNSHLKYLKWNFYYNQKQQHPDVDCLRENFSGKTVILLAGGPSLEKSLDFLKSLDVNDTSYVLLAVGTSYRGLIKNNIVPDYVIMTDSGDRMLYQLKDIPKTKSSLIYLSTASDRAVKEFNGNKYIMYQSGFDEAEKYAIEQGLTLFETGGSVSTTAIDLALRFNCKKLITLGLDLSYPNNTLHSFAGAQIKNDSSMLQVPSVAGGNVPTTNVLSIYRKWIEERISSGNSIPVINISDGAYINNAKNIPVNSLDTFKFE